MAKDPSGTGTGTPTSVHDTGVGKLLSEGHDAVTMGADALIDTTVGGVSGELMKAGAQITIRSTEGAWKGLAAAGGNLMEGNISGAATDGVKYAMSGFAEGVGTGAGKLGAKVGLVEDAGALGKDVRAMYENSFDQVLSGEALGIKDEGPAQQSAVKAGTTPATAPKATGKDAPAR